MLKLGISVNSFHYKYYQILRGIWGFGAQKKQTGLCTYTQFLFWFSILSVVFLPLMIIGWSILKTGRFLYKILSYIPGGKFIIDILDKFNIGNKMESISDTMEENPAIALLMVFFSFIISIIIIGIAALGITACILGSKIIAIHLISLIMLFELGIFNIFYGIGWILAKAYSVVLLSIINFIIDYSFVIGALIGCLIISAALMIIITKILMSSKTISNFLLFKINGFHQARKDNSGRREKRKNLKAEIKYKKKSGEIYYYLHNNFILYIITKFKNIFGRTTKIKESTFHMVSFMGVIWETIKGIKYGICPFVEFIDEKEKVEK